MIVMMLRTIVLYILIVVGIRIMGKRQLGELQPSELVVTILVSNIATLPIEDTNVPLIGGIIPIITLVCSEILISTLILKSSKARKIISGNSIVLIRDGHIDQLKMKELRFSIDDIMAQLRSNQIFDLKDVSMAIVETTGKLSVYEKFASRTVTNEFLNIQNNRQEESPPVVLISDGELEEQSLGFCNITKEWLENILKQNNYNIKDIFIMTCDKNQDYLIIPKEKI